jgi:DMSO/TMAO reductase YedYZ molybdopterin-dependent catalytic subunit
VAIHVSRRDIFKIAGVAAVTAALATGAKKILISPAGTPIKKLNNVLPKALKFLPSPPADPALSTPGLTPLFTPNKDFFRIDIGNGIPTISLDSWRLTLGGMVDHPKEFTYEELISRPIFELDATIACVSNEVGGKLAGNARWTGISLDDLIHEAGPSKNADQVMGFSDDGFSAGFPIAALDGRGAMLAFGMNGEVLPLENGYPARIIVPGLFGYVSATKWITQLEVTRFDQREGYWMPRGWSAQGPIKLASRIDTPEDSGFFSVGKPIEVGPNVIAGVAWSSMKSISRVEVRINNEPWVDATLGPELAATTWRQWWLDWNAVKGTTEITVRATDSSGEVQSNKSVGTVPNGSEGWHAVKVDIG